jgi:fructose-bisphosphate aldolase class II
VLVGLKEILDGVKNKLCAVPAFNVFGYEDAIAVVRAAEEMNAPVMLATNKAAVEHMPINLLGKLLTGIAGQANVPVCVHLDHGKDYQTVAEAIMSGYTSVMYDGSQLPLKDNIRTTAEIVKLAHTCGVLAEAEIGAVGYSDPNMNYHASYTDPEEAKVFAEETGVDALAVAIGSVHRMEEQAARVQFGRLESIEKLIDTPIVIHGSTGIVDEDLKKLITYNVAKVNIGTALRMAFGQTLRDEINNDRQNFDRIALSKKPMEAVKKTAKEKIQLLETDQFSKEPVSSHRS